jgi:hypothetical protein
MQIPRNVGVTSLATPLLCGDRSAREQVAGPTLVLRPQTETVSMRVITAALFVAMFVLVSHLQGSVEAYLDPGTGSMALQLLIAGLVGVLATVRLYWDRVRTFFVRRHAQGEGPRNTHA